MKRAIIIVLDAVGIGELPDADKYGDKGSNTLMHVKEALPALNLKNMCNLGLGLIDGDNVYEKVNNPKGIYGKMAETFCRQRYYNWSLGNKWYMD